MTRKAAVDFTRKYNLTFNARLHEEIRIVLEETGCSTPATTARSILVKIDEHIYKPDQAGRPSGSVRIWKKDKGETPLLS